MRRDVDMAASTAGSEAAARTSASKLGRRRGSGNFAVGALVLLVIGGCVAELILAEMAPARGLRPGAAVEPRDRA